jgi:bacillolysin
VHPLLRRDAGLHDPAVVGAFINNASYLPGYNVMIYGDGDGVGFDYFAGSLDVVAHELTHGVTDFSSQLEYRDEPGALNEAFSDIMAVAIEFYHLGQAAGPQQGPNFLLAEDITRGGAGFIRSMANPVASGYPDHYSLRQHVGTPFDNGGVHVNSTIVSHAFYLAVVGGTHRVSRVAVQGIGLANMDRMERVFYRAFVFLLGPLSQFRDARAATLQAAADLYGPGSLERAQLQQAWNAVGVF